MIAPAAEARTTRVGGFAIPGFAKAEGPRQSDPHEIDLPHPAIEELPCFHRRVDSATLSHGIRHYNGSLASLGNRIFMAYRVESFRAVSTVGLCEMDREFAVIHDRRLHPIIDPQTHIEDPHMASVGGKLYVIVSNVVRGFPNICRQRMLEVDPDTLEVVKEHKLQFGNVNGVEKNWTPFELPNGHVGVVYKQRPRTIIDVETREGWTTLDTPMGPKDSSLSGRTGPLRISEVHYLEFVGGHVKLDANDKNGCKRGTRYWFGVVIFEAKAPFNVVGYTKEPLVWASEASGTIFNPLPRGGHPVCILPAGATVSGDDVHVSCGVNDSYIAILRFGLSELLTRCGVAK